MPGKAGRMTPKDIPGLDPAILQTLQDCGELIIAGRLVKAEKPTEKTKLVEDGES
jgi:hypothetical protein